MIGPVLAEPPGGRAIGSAWWDSTVICPTRQEVSAADSGGQAGSGQRGAGFHEGLQAPPPGDGSPHVELSDAPGQLRSAAEQAAQAWGDDSSLSLSYPMPWGEEYTGATLVDMYLAELAAHAWDLARATGQLDKLDPSLARPALEGARAMIKPQYRNMVGPGAPFGAEVSPAPGADDWERLAAFTGRDPRTTPGR